MTIVTTGNSKFRIQKKLGQAAFQYFKNTQMLTLWWLCTSEGRCLHLMEKVSWPFGVSIYEDMEFYRLLILEMKDWGEEAVGIH